MPRRIILALAVAFALIAGLPLRPQAASAQERFITLASTTSTEESGLFGYLLPIFREATGIDVRVVAVGTGQALAIGARGDADVTYKKIMMKYFKTNIRGKELPTN